MQNYWINKKNLIVIGISIIFPIAAICQLPSYLPTNGLVAWYPFNGNANDDSGNGNNGVVNGASLSTDRFGIGNSSYALDNSNNDYIDFADVSSLNNTNQFSISVWFKYTSYPSAPNDWYTILSDGSYSDPNGFGLIITPTNILFRNNSSFGILLTADIPFNEWNHIVCLYSPNTVQIFLNGYAVGTNTHQNSSSFNTSYSLKAGKCDDLPIDANDHEYYFNGLLDDIAIYNRALTAAEVTALYTSTPTNTGGTTSTNPAPLGIPYQAEVRNENREVLANATVNVRFTLHELTANGTVSYQETHAITTNELGLFAATIGAGTATQGTFPGINWAQTTKFLQVEIDAGNGYITMGNQQLMSVPYALYAANGPAGPQGPVGADGAQGPIGPQGEPGLNGSSSNLIFGAHNISYNSELNLSQNGIRIINESGVSSWGGGGVSFTVPAGKVWKLVGYAAGNNVIGVYSVGETWLDEGESISFEGNGGSLTSVPFKFTAFEYTKSGFDFEIISEQGFSSWGGGGVAFTVPVGKVWKIVGYSAGNGVFGVYNIGETWLDEGQTISFEGNGGSLTSVPFKFTAFEYTK